jgi:GAF domain-containing protein
MLEKMMSDRLEAEGTFEGAVRTIVRDVVALQGAEYGDVQLLMNGDLVVVAEVGLTAEFLKTFMVVKSTDGCACGRALRERKSIVIEDVERDADYAIFRSDARAAGYRGVQSTPLTTSEGQVIGVISTLFANPHVPTQIEMVTLKSYAIRAADRLKALGGGSLEAKVECMSAELCVQFGIERHQRSVA